MYHVAIIGCGNIGSRHLQALAFADIPLYIQVVDPVQKSLDLARSRWNEMQGNPLAGKIEFMSDMQCLHESLDVAIIATSSAQRRKILENLLEIKQVKYLVLEKIVFQNMEDFSFIHELLKKNHVSAWVNCPRRMQSFYQKLKKELSESKFIDMGVTGSGWGMGCNSIHHLDLFSYLTNQQEYHADATGLDDRWIDSKRSGYIEFTGRLTFSSPYGFLRLTSYKGGCMPVLIIIANETLQCIIDESMDIAHIRRNIGGKWTWEKVTMNLLPQSRMTHLLVKQLVETGRCDLTSYDETIGLHDSILSAFLSHMNRFTDEKVTSCPIT